MLELAGGPKPNLTSSFSVFFGAPISVFLAAPHRARVAAYIPVSLPLPDGRLVGAAAPLGHPAERGRSAGAETRRLTTLALSRCRLPVCSEATGSTEERSPGSRGHRRPANYRRPDGGSVREAPPLRPVRRREGCDEAGDDVPHGPTEGLPDAPRSRPPGGRRIVLSDLICSTVANVDALRLARSVQAPRGGEWPPLPSPARASAPAPPPPPPASALTVKQAGALGPAAIPTPKCQKCAAPRAASRWSARHVGFLFF